MRGAAAVLVFALAGEAALAAEDPPGSPPGAVRAIAVERRAYRIGETPPSSLVYVASDAGVFRGDPDGGRWSRAGEVPGGAAVTALAAVQRARPLHEPLVAHRTLVEYETALLAGTAGSGVFRSTDGGASWTPVPAAGLSGAAVAALVVDGEGVVYAATRDGRLFRGSGGGERWAAIGGTLPLPVGALGVDPTRGGLLFAGAATGLFRSQDGGSTWSALRVADSETVFEASSIAVSPDTPSLLFAAGRTRCRGCGSPPSAALYRSRDGGSHWSRVARAVEGPLVFAPGSPAALYAVAAGAALETGDEGATWKAAGDGEPLRSVLAVDPERPGRLYGLSPSGDFARVDPRCRPDAAALCLAGGRFRVEVDWDPRADEDGTPGASSAADGSGAFWRARPSNVLLTVEIRDGRRNNGHFWLDFDARTIRAFSVVVTDMATGASTRYAHPEGQRTRFTDHEAF